MSWVNWFAFHLSPAYARQRRLQDNLRATLAELSWSQQEAFFDQLDTILRTAEIGKVTSLDREMRVSRIEKQYEKLDRQGKDAADKFFAKLLFRQQLHLVFLASADQLAAVEQLLVETWTEIFLRGVRFGYLSVREIGEVIAVIQDILSDVTAACLRMGIEPPIGCSVPADSDIPTQARAMFEVMFLVIPARKFLPWIAARRMHRLRSARS